MRLFSSSSQALPTLLALLLAAALLHLGFGAKNIPVLTTIKAFSSFDNTNFDHIVIRQMRVPRMITAMAVGAALSVAGALMQGVTRNPLADPGLLALMSGASFGVVVGTHYFAIEADIWIPALATAGALLAALLVVLITQLIPGGRSPALLLLCGAAVAAFLSAVVSGINLLNEESFATFRVWLSGAITADAFSMLPYAAPWLIVGLLIALLSAREVTVLAMGHEAATGLGVNAMSLSIRLLLCVVILTAAAVALVGPLGFVGLVIPHTARLLVGSDYRWVIPCSAILGALFLLLVDLVARIVIAPVEIATGVVTTLLGAPLFVWLVRRIL